MDDVPEIDFESASFARSFVRQLDEDDREYFKDILGQLEDEFDGISPLQKGQMAVAYMIQEYLMGKAFNSAKNDDVELTVRDEKLLDWSRKQYNSNVNKLYDDENVNAKRRSVPDILAEWQRDSEMVDGERIEVEDDFERYSAVEVDVDAFDEAEADDDFEAEPGDDDGGVDISEPSGDTRGDGVDGRAGFAF